MISRLLTNLLTDRLKNNPAVALLGARQSGKTTLAKSLNGKYFDMENPGDRLKLDLSWPELESNDTLCIIDEAQTAPDIFPRLRGLIDARRKTNGRFLLLGSVGPALMTQVSESLAGRLSLLELSPILLSEMPHHLLDTLWLKGGFPDGGVLSAAGFPTWQLDYLQLLSQRDLPNLGLPAKPQVTGRLLRMVAALHGQLWNASQIGQSLGVNYQTVNSYMDFIEGSFLVRRLPPLHANLSKRLVKRPKYYWRDSGLLHALLNITNLDFLLAQPWVGASWEGFVIEQILGFLNAKGLRANPSFFRTSDQYEIDLVLEGAGKPLAIEIKLTSSPSHSDMQRLDKTADLIKAGPRILVTRTPEPIESGFLVSTNLPDLFPRLEAYFHD